MPREITTHAIPNLPPGQYAELSVIAGDADRFGVPHEYFLCQELNGIRELPVQEVTFQSGDPRKGWNGGTSLAYLAAVRDFLESCQRSQFGCDENLRAIGHIAAAMEQLKARIVRRHSEGTFQTHQAGPGEVRAQVGDITPLPSPALPPDQRT